MYTKWISFNYAKINMIYFSKTFCILKLSSIFAPTITDRTGCSVARSSRLVWDQEVAGSNPATPTERNHYLVVPFFIHFT